MSGKRYNDKSLTSIALLFETLIFLPYLYLIPDDECLSAATRAGRLTLKLP